MPPKRGKKPKKISEEQLSIRKQARVESEAQLQTFCQYTSCKAPKEMIIVSDWKEFLDGNFISL